MSLTLYRPQIQDIVSDTEFDLVSIAQGTVPSGFAFSVQDNNADGDNDNTTGVVTVTFDSLATTALDQQESITASYTVKP